jgi:hypothetical protein
MPSYVTVLSSFQKSNICAFLNWHYFEKKTLSPTKIAIRKNYPIFDGFSTFFFQFYFQDFYTILKLKIKT